MIFFWQATEGIVTAASIYVLIGLAWNMTLNACGYFNLAMGEFFILGAMLSYKLETSWGVTSPLLVVPISVLAVGAVGFVAERWLIRPLKDRGLAPLIVTIGIALVLLQLANLLSSATVISPQVFVSGEIAPGGVHIQYQELIVWGSALFVCIAFLVFFTRTDRGRVVRACVDNRTGAAHLGIKVASYATAAFTVSAMLAGFAGVLIAPIQAVEYNSGDFIALKALLAVSILGVGRNGAAVVGAFLVAALEGYLAQYVSPDTADVVLLVAFIVVLCSYGVRSEGAALLPPWLRIRRRSANAGATESAA